MAYKVKFQIDLPASLYSRREIDTLHRYSSYKHSESQIKQLKNVFITGQGLVLNNGLLELGSAINLIGKRDSTVYWPFWKSTIEQYFVCKWGKSLTALKFPDDKPYILIHSKWFNYFFWITDYVSRLIRAEQAGFFKSSRLIVPDFFNRVSYVKDIIQLFDVEHKRLPSGDFANVSRLVMPTTREWRDSFNQNDLMAVRYRLLDEAARKFPLDREKTRIFYVRKPNTGRNIINEEEVFAFLAERGFIKVVFDNYSVLEQIDLVRNAEVLIGVHGAGLTNAMFMPEGGLCVELFESDFFHYHHTFPYWKLSGNVGVEYLPLVCESPETGSFIVPRKRDFRVRQKMLNRDIFIDLKKLSKIVDSKCR